MRFTCDACNAQYMISDEKVGPNGVKVRCKKCGHIILVKRASEEAAAAPAPEPAPAPLSGDGLDAELGQAFDKVLGETPAPAGDLPAPAAAAAAGDAAPAAAAPVQPAAGPGNEWYVAVDDQQVGPLAAPAVKGKWESGEIGPDSLVWKPGLDDWKPLSQVPELQQFLAPVPRPSGRPRPAARPPPPNLAAPAAAAPKEPEWKPAAASALAALASEEMATMKASEPARPSPAASARPGGKGSLVDAMNLPEGGVDPTGAIPLPIKGLERTGESRLERKSSVARTTAELRIKRSANRTILVVAAVMLLLLAGGVGGVFWYFQQRILPPAEQAAAPQAPRTFAPPIPAPTQPPPAAAPQAPAQAAAPPPAAPQATPPQPAPEPAAAAPAAAAPPPSPAAPKKKPAPVAAPAEKPAPKKVARAEVPPPPAPTPTPAPKKKSASDPFEAGGGDDEFEKLLNEPQKRSVYVPPAPGGEVAEKVSTGQIQEAVAGKMGALRDCLAKQQASEPEAHGEVTVTWDIDPDGRPSAVSTGKAGNQPFAQCLVGVVKSIRFPKSRQGNKGEDKVRFPFRY